ncbi:DJ-1/PfpI family protein [Pseudomonas capsici]|uniref:DJ-1/PfpI family protein n=1 Tax=Pseudomonas capsici TaxID=2810614 RepID=UPI0021F1E5A7|nr:DJ-1/PfpI family protein [Pseudomonas capsici]MCV4275844.1 DJ-1/PfpI family protein [Pseudomonas capsici]
MIDNQRRNLMLGALLVPLAASIPRAVSAAEKPTHEHTMPDMERDMDKVQWIGDEQIGMLIYPGMTVMDLIGPHCMFGSLMGAKIHIVAKTLDPVTSDAGLTIIPSTTFDTCPRDLTVLFTPGGTDGTLATATDAETLAFMADRGARAKYITSVCSGSLILGAAGLLKGYKATSHWSCRDALAGFGAIPTDARVVRDRNRITGAGVTAGLDFGLSMVAELRDQTYAECAQLMGEYDPDPPFNAGSMKTAPPKVKTAMIELVADFTKKAEALSSAAKG